MKPCGFAVGLFLLGPGVVLAAGHPARVPPPRTGPPRGPGIMAPRPQGLNLPSLPNINISPPKVPSLPTIIGSGPSLPSLPPPPKWSLPSVPPLNTIIGAGPPTNSTFDDPPIPPAPPPNSNGGHPFNPNAPGASQGPPGKINGDRGPVDGSGNPIKPGASQGATGQINAGPPPAQGNKPTPGGFSGGIGPGTNPGGATNNGASSGGTTTTSNKPPSPPGNTGGNPSAGNATAGTNPPPGGWNTPPGHGPHPWKPHPPHYPDGWNSGGFDGGGVGIAAADDSSGVAPTEEGSAANDATATQQTRRYLRIDNETGQKMRVYVQYQTLNQNNQWVWNDKPLSYDFEPGESSYVDDGDWKINAVRARAWGVLADGSTRDTYKNQDLWLVPEQDANGNHVYVAPEMETHTVTFN